MHTMFSMTIVICFVTLCALLIQSAIKAIDSSFVTSPTVEPGLQGCELMRKELE